MTLATLIKDNKVTFDSYRAGFFYYNIYQPGVGDMFRFPVPVEDVGNGTMLAQDKAITYMRWIRKAIEDGTFILISKLVGELEENINLFDPTDPITL